MCLFSARNYLCERDILEKQFLYDVVDKQFFSSTTESLEKVMHCKKNYLVD
jgi:hypothetical protein